LLGLEIESLQDLSWTDPSLGVQDCAWYPEEDQSSPLSEYKEYGTETLTINADRKVVVSSKTIVDMSPEKIAKIQANKATALQKQKEELTQNIADMQAQLSSL